jgi:hypothetical protein
MEQQAYMANTSSGSSHVSPARLPVQQEKRA